MLIAILYCVMLVLFNRLLKEIEAAENFLLVSHRNPDPDTVGSALALGGYLESRGKRADYFCADKIPNNFKVLKNIHRFTDGAEILEKNYGAVIFMDCAESSRCGLPDILWRKKHKRVSIDHHLLRENFADIDIRDEQASATAEIIFKFFRYLGVKINFDMATQLLSGILIDTDFCVNAATTNTSIKIAGELSALGANWRGIAAAFRLNKNIEILQLWGRALSRLKYNEENNVATTAILKEDAYPNMQSDDATSGFSNFLNSILQSDAVIVYEEHGENIRGSLRTAKDGANVALMAKEYGGGGHARAAGFTCKGKLIELDDKWVVEKK